MLIVGMNFAVRLLHCLMGRVTLEFGKVQKDYYYQISINHFLEDNSYIVNTKKTCSFHQFHVDTFPLVTGISY